MAIQILPEKPGVGEFLGAGLGTGLSQGLQLLAQQKLGELAQRGQQQRTRSALESLGVTPDQSAGIAALPQNLQAEYVRNMRRQAQQAALSQALGGAPQQVAPGPQQMQQPGVVSPQESVSQAFGGADIPLQQQVQLAQMQQKEKLAQQRLQQQRELAQQKLSARDQERIDKETEKTYESYSTAGEDARNKIPLVQEFIRLSLEGDPGSPASNTMRDIIGNFAFGKDVPKDWLYTNDATVQRKLSNQLVKLTLEKMQGRKSVEVLKAIRRTFPNIYQNREAQLAIAKTLLYEYTMNDLKDKLQEQIIAENNGRRPRNLKSLVKQLSDRLEPAVSQKYLPNLAAYKARGGTI